MSHTHAVVWLDTKEAHVFQFNAEEPKPRFAPAAAAARAADLHGVLRLG